MTKRYFMVGCFALLAVLPLQAVIMVLKPLQDFTKEADFVALAKVEKFYPDKPALMLAVTEDIRGKSPFQKLPVVVQKDLIVEKVNHSEVFLKRVAEDLPVMLFGHAKGDKYFVFGYTNGTWFHLQKGGADSNAWKFVNCEPYLRRTYKGTTEEMRKLVGDALKGKKKWPEPLKDEEPGYGPELKK